MEVQRCDVCGNSRRKAKGYRIGRHEEAGKLYWLCREHAAPLDALLAIPGHSLRSKPRSKQWTMEEIAEMKKTAP